MRETNNALLLGLFADVGLDENTLLRGNVDRVEQQYSVALAALYVFQPTSLMVRPFAGAGTSIELPQGPFRPDLRFGLALLGFGASNALLEVRWVQTAADFTLGWTVPL